MKIQNLLLIAILAFFVGCGTTRQGPPVVTTQPVFALDDLGMLKQVGETNIVSDGVEWVPDARLTGAIASAKAITTAGASIPSPAQPLFTVADLAVGGIGSLVALFAAYKSKRLTLANAALAATTTVIETAENASALKEAARKAATANGSQDFLHSTVKNL